MNFVTIKIGSWSHFACECDNCSKIMAITFKLNRGVPGTKISDKFDNDLYVTLKNRSKPTLLLFTSKMINIGMAIPSLYTGVSNENIISSQSMLLKQEVQHFLAASLKFWWLMPI